MLTFIIGVFCGAILGAWGMAVLAAGARADLESELVQLQNPK